MTSIPPEHPVPNGPVRAISIRKVLVMVGLVMLMVIAWGLTNMRLNREILEQLKGLHQKVDSLGPTKSE